MKRLICVMMALPLVCGCAKRINLTTSEMTEYVAVVTRIVGNDSQGHSLISVVGLNNKFSEMVSVGDGGWTKMLLRPGRYMIASFFVGETSGDRYFLGQITAATSWEVRALFEVTGASGALYIGDLVLEKGKWGVISNPADFDKVKDTYGIPSYSTNEMRLME